MTSISPANEEAIEAWDGVLFDRFVQFRRIVTHGLGAHGEAALRAHPPERGARVLDIGCGFGDTAQRLAEIVGPEGSVLGVDAGPRFIEASRDEAAAAGVTNVRFEVADIEMHEFGEEFDYAYSRFGTMFFANPVAAMRNVRKALRPGGQLCSVVWRRKLDNEWMHRAELTVKDYLEKNEDSDEPTCGPGPFSMANADTVSDVLLAAGFEDIALERVDIPINIGEDLDNAIEFACGLGPAGEVIRLAGEKADEIRPVIEAALAKSLAEFEGPDGVVASASTWTITASAPGA
jgi:ubiquinone/menaquinone biosynthesis C-methylase UbiE